MTLDLRSIAQAMGGEVAGNVAKFPTPGHSKADRGSWAKLAPDAPDGVLIHSSNGGDPLAIKDLLRDKGVLPAWQRSTRRRDVAAWEYTDAEGAVLYRKVRSEPGKQFRFEHPDGNGGWKAGRGCDAVPYRLAALLAAPANATIYLVEGEKQADKLASWGLVATSLKDWRTEFGFHVGARKVVILPDNDDPGRKQAQDAHDRLVVSGIATIVTIALPALPQAGDIMDWDGDRAALEALVVEAFGRPADAPARLTVLDVASWEKQERPPRLWEVDNLVPRRQTTLFAGDGGVGKSLAAQQALTCYALGLPFLRIETAGRRALYLTCEDDGDELHRRQKDICAELGVRLSDLSGKLDLVTLAGEAGNALATFDGADVLHPTPRWRQIVAHCVDNGVGLVVLDNVAHLMGGDLKELNLVTAFVNLVTGLAIAIDGGVILIGHENKDKAEYFGSVAWNNAVRSRLHLARDEADSDVRHLKSSKANYSAGGEAASFRWRAGAFVHLDDLTDREGSDLAATTRASGDNKLFLDCLSERTRQARAVSEKHSASFAPTVFAAMPESRNIGKARLHAAMDRLFAIGKIERAELWKGVDRKPVYGLRATAAGHAGRAGDGLGETQKTAENRAGNTVRGTARETRETVAETAENRAGDAGNTHTTPKGDNGFAPLRAGAPCRDEGEGQPTRSRVIFPAIDDPDDPNDPVNHQPWSVR